MWISGTTGAVGGVLVPGPARGRELTQFVQGSAPAIDFFDVGTVVATGLRLCVPAGCFDNVVKISETRRSLPKTASQLKFYAPNVGLVQVTAEGGSAGRP